MFHLPPIEQSLEHVLLVASQLDASLTYGLVLCALLCCGIGVPIPEDITLLTTGLLSSTGQITLPGAIACGFVGVIAGDGFMFLMGRRYGRRIFRMPVLNKIFTDERICAAERRILSNQHFICFIARFLPGLRAPIFATAGMMGVKPRIFFLQDGIAAMLSVPIWVYLGHWFGSNWGEALAKAKKVQWLILLSVLLAIFIYMTYRLLQKKRKQRFGMRSPSIAPREAEFENRS